ncbi:MAG: DNA helicase RecQ [Oscillospiraceae bacterium]|nr:DNA helicase RecQ [Oscillospiraceae bacterium]
MDKQSVLQERFGFRSFRDGQEALIDAILSGRDVFGVMPTGGGKSLCYQIPALLLEGLTLVVSPLISLMKDQVAALKEAGIPAAFLNSSLTAAQQREVLRRAGLGAYRLIYVAPERLLTDSFLAFAAGQRISLLAVDEAHCVSQWGQDFRPNYLDVPAFIRRLPRRPVIAAFTATATAEVGEDVVRLLELREPLRLVTGFDRPNLYFDVRRERNKTAWLMDYLEARRDKSGIVYCATRKTVEQVCEKLRAAGFAATRYHAGLDDAERRENQEDFAYDRATVMVATNAFGMGIDKSNVSFVIHYNMPKNIESYYQEAGRAGRDGAPADCVLLFSPGDVITAEYLIENGSEREQLDEALRAQLLIRDMRRLRQMQAYCKTGGCYRAALLDYFGEAHAPGCGNCGNCAQRGEEPSGETVEEDLTLAAQKILSCVRRVERKNGVGLGETMIVRILTGSRDKTLLAREYDLLPTYGVMKDCKRPLLHEYVRALVKQGYLLQVPGDYEVLRTAEKANRVLFENEAVLWRHAASKQTRPGRKPAAAGGPGAAEQSLFDRLRGLRAELARQAGVPAYVIFHDASLLKLAELQPATEPELLTVPGVGEQKAKKYGRAVLAVIAEWKQEQQGKKSSKAKKKEPQPPLHLRPEQLARYVCDPDGISMTEFARRLTALQEEGEAGELTGRQLSEQLLAEGYLKEQSAETDNLRRRPTPAGESVGITLTERSGKDGRAFTMVTLTEEAQRWLIGRLSEGLIME